MSNRLPLIITAAFATIIAFSSCAQGADPSPESSPAASPGPSPASSPVTPLAPSFDFVFEQGAAGPYGNVYAAWIESGSYLQNIVVCERVATEDLTGEVLPYWSMNKRQASTDLSLATDSQGNYVDGITAASVFGSDFTKTFTLRDASVRQFRVYFEFDNSSVYNDWFYATHASDDYPAYYVEDQPAILYWADVDLDASAATEFELTLHAWTPNADTPRILPASVTMVNGTPVGETRYITHHKNGADFGDPYSGTPAATTDMSMASIVKKVALRRR